MAAAAIQSQKKSGKTVPRRKTSTTGKPKAEAARSPRPLPPAFILGDNDVLCGRGSECFNHEGNIRFREIVRSYVEIYSSLTNKNEKSAIINLIVNQIRQLSPHGGFLKKDLLTGQYSEVGDFVAREKTSQAFRDALGNKSKAGQVSNLCHLEGEVQNMEMVSSKNTPVAVSPCTVPSTIVKEAEHVFPSVPSLQGTICPPETTKSSSLISLPHHQHDPVPNPLAVPVLVEDQDHKTVVKDEQYCYHTQESMSVLSLLAPNDIMLLFETWSKESDLFL